MSSLIVNGYGPLAELLDVSPFAAKLDAYLRLAKLDYHKRVGSMGKAPRGKMPYLEHDGRTIGDSGRIIEYLRDAGLADLDAWLDEAQRAELCALSSMLELELYFIIVYFRWQAPAGWASYRPVVQAFMRELGVPGLLAPLISRFVRRGVLGQVEAQGVGRREHEENLARARELFDALEQFVSRHPGAWWFGAQPSSADAMAHAFVTGATTRAIDTPMQNLLDDRPGLRAWFEHADALIRTTAKD